MLSGQFFYGCKNYMPGGVQRIKYRHKLTKVLTQTDHSVHEDVKIFAVLTCVF